MSNTNSPVRLSSIDDSAVTAIHPGPGKDYTPPRQPLASPSERLCKLERELLDAAVEYHADRRIGTLGELAVAVVVARTQVRS